MAQSTLARRIEVTRQFVGQILSGQRLPSEAMTDRIAKAVGVPVSALPLTGARTRRLRTSQLARLPAVDVAALQLALKGASDARNHLLGQGVARLIAPAVGKPDTLALDSECEIILIDQLRRLSEDTVILSEERRDERRADERAMYFALDPFDRSRPAAARLAELASKGLGDKPLYAVLPELRKSLFGALGSPFVGITFIRGLVPRFSVLADYLTGQVVVACAAFVKVGTLEAGLEELELEGEDLVFEPRKGFAAVFFPGDGQTADDRRRLARALELEDHPAVLERPGGPARVLALASLEGSLEAPRDIAVVASVGEKLTEFVHWVGIAVHSKSLAVYELSPEGAFAQDRLLLAPSERYSIFRRSADGTLSFDETTLRRFGAGYRGCLAVTHAGSLSANARLRSLPFVRELLGGFG